MLRHEMSKQHNKRVQYSPSKMSAAIEMVRGAGMAKAKAAKMFGVPRTTLLDKLAGRVPESPTRPGPAPVLTTAEEKTVVEYTKLMFRIGYPLTKKELLYEVKRILDIDGRKTSFKDNLPGKGWYQAFQSRNPEVVERTPAALGHHRAAISMDMIQGWYDGIFQFLQEEVPGYEQLINDLRRIFNADESGFPICIKSSRALAPSGSKHVYQVLPGDKSQLTVMACFNAFGNYMSPLIVYPGQWFRDTVLSGFEEAIFGTSKNGWMDSELFIAFLEHFDEFLSLKNVDRPVILFVDGHSTHMSKSAAQFCADNGIILYCLLPNATHVLQACDIGLFSPMKSKWREMVKKWQMVHLGEVFTKTHFPEVFKSTWEAVATLTNSVSAFKRSGLFPLTPEGIDKTKLNPSECLATVVPTTSSKTSTRISFMSDNRATPSSVHTPSSVSVAVPSQSQSADLSCSLLNPTPSPQALTTVSVTLSPTLITGEQNVCTLSASDQTVASPGGFEPGPSCSRSLPCIVSSVARSKGDSSFVSEAFNYLRVPEIKQKKTVNTLRQKLPKALSGAVALNMLKEREEKKKREEQAKIERKTERERKKREREIEKERKKQEREIKKKIKIMEKKKSKENDSDTSSDESIHYMDSSDDEGVRCPVCLSGEGGEWEWIGCEGCPLWWHIDCTGRDDFVGKRARDLAGVNFLCEMCV